MVSAVGGYGHGPSLGQQSAINHFAADDQSARVGKQGSDIRRPANFQGFLKISDVRHSLLLLTMYSNNGGRIDLLLTPPSGLTSNYFRINELLSTRQG
jgi:hypothetical protein